MTTEAEDRGRLNAAEIAAEAASAQANIQAQLDPSKDGQEIVAKPGIARHQAERREIGQRPEISLERRSRDQQERDRAIADFEANSPTSR